MGYAARLVCRMVFIDDVIVFAIFLAVCSPRSKALPFLKDGIEQVLADGISVLVVVP
jgi:hypothetical protein